MDNKISMDQLGFSGKISCKSINNLVVKSADVETEGVVRVHPPSSPSTVDKCGFACGPVTPDSNNESSEKMSCFTSPQSLVFASDLNKNMKNIEESRSYVSRRLNYKSVVVTPESDCEKAVKDDGMLLEAVYDSILECIMSDVLGEISAVDDTLKTPRFAPRLTGIAEICPGPPLKSVRMTRNIDLSLCRKLEF